MGLALDAFRDEAVEVIAAGTAQKH